MGIADPFGVRLVAVGETVQKVQNFIWRYFVNLNVTEFPTEPIDDRLIRPYGIFFEWVL